MKRIRIGALGIEIIRPGHGGFADWPLLRRRTYLRAIRLPRGRALVVSWLPLVLALLLAPASSAHRTYAIHASGHAQAQGKHTFHPASAKKGNGVFVSLLAHPAHHHRKEAHHRKRSLPARAPNTRTTTGAVTATPLPLPSDAGGLGGRSNAGRQLHSRGSGINAVDSRVAVRYAVDTLIAPATRERPGARHQEVES